MPRRADRDASRLLDQIRAAGVPVPHDATFIRVYAGYWQRAAGAWSWELADAEGVPLHPPVGSQHRRSELRGQVAVTWDRYTFAWQVDPDQGGSDV